MKNQRKINITIAFIVGMILALLLAKRYGYPRQVAKKDETLIESRI